MANTQIGAPGPGMLAAGPVCPDENALAELVQGLLAEDVAGRIELHLDTCEQCRRIVSSVGQSSYLVARRTRAVGSGASGPSTWSMASPPVAMHIPEPGTLLAGKYRVEGVLGQGGMGVVLAAKHLTLGKLVALKVMRPDLAVDAMAAQRFVREARAASLLRSEHIARVIDLDTLDDGSPYIAMEYLEGEDLGAMLANRGTIPAHEAAIYIVQVCEAIAEAHAAGIVHRDLKPANLFLTQRAKTPCVKVLDFGVSKIIAGGPLLDDVASTDTKSLVGSPHYMAPEQLISAKAVDPRTDIWALGCILFELVAGKSPFNTGAALAEVMASILRDNTPSLRELCPVLDPRFVAIVERCLDKDPALRFQRVDELAEALIELATPSEGAPVPLARSPRATSIGVAVGAPAPLAAAPAMITATTHIASRRSIVWIVAGIAAVAIALVALLASRPPATTSSQPAPALTAPTAPPPPVAPTAAPPPAPAAEPAVAPEPAKPATAPPVAPAKKPAAKSRAKKLEDDLIGPSF